MTDRNPWHTTAALGLLVIIATLLAGCDDGRPERAPVSGIVTYQGKPVEGARVTFYCPGARPASASTDADGRFTLWTYDPADGAVAGTHAVTVVKTKPVEGVDLTDPGRMVDHLLPMRYNNPDTSPLTAEVTFDGENDFRFDLTD